MVSHELFLHTFSFLELSEAVRDRVSFTGVFREADSVGGARCCCGVGSIGRYSVIRCVDAVETALVGTQGSPPEGEIAFWAVDVFPLPFSVCLAFAGGFVAVGGL
jgi:hypothetical protein